MSDYEYIYQQMKKAHYIGWDDEELRKWVEMLIGDDFKRIYLSKVL